MIPKKVGHQFLLIFFFLSFLNISAQVLGTPLFDGSNLDKWELGPEGGFEIVNNELYTGTFKKGNDLFTKKEYANYILKLEYNLSTVGNSGVIIRCTPDDPWGTGVEVQLLAPWTPRRDNLHCTGSLYGYVAVTDRPDETPNKWHDMEIRCDRKLITVFVDGKLTTQAKIDTIPKMENKLLKGVIGLQVNHAEVEGQYTKFRNIFIEDLDQDPDYIAKGFYEKDVKLRALAHKSALSLGSKMIRPLSKFLAEKNVMARDGAKQVLFDLIVGVTTPQKKETIKIENAKKELLQCVEETSSKYTKAYLNELLRMIENTEN